HEPGREREQCAFDEVELLVREGEYCDVGARSVEPRASVAERGRERALAAAEEAVGAAPAVATVHRLHLEAAAKANQQVRAQVCGLMDGEHEQPVLVDEGVCCSLRCTARAEASEGERGQLARGRYGPRLPR